MRKGETTPLTSADMSANGFFPLRKEDTIVEGAMEREEREIGSSEIGGREVI